VTRELRYRSDARVVACSDPARLERDLLFHARVAVEQRCDLWSLAASRLPYLLLLDAREMESLALVPGLREVARYAYVPATTLGVTGLRQGVEPGLLILAANFKTDDAVAERKRRRDRRHALQAEEESAGEP
jgi:hypothetical protein